MARLVYEPIPKDDKAAALEAIAAYKAQNPVKYEQKKEALFARYGLDSVKDSVEVPDDANDIELKELKKKVADILLSLQDTDRNFTLELLMLLELLHNLQPMMDQLQRW